MVTRGRALWGDRLTRLRAGLAVVALESRSGEQNEPREDELADTQTGGLGR